MYTVFMNMPDPLHFRPKRAKRSDGLTTRAHLLNIAGKVFAERGYSDTTSKEICEIAGTNLAAVNYYFGGKESLYEEVLIEAHKQMLSLDDLNEIIESQAAPADKLRSLLSILIGTARASSELWGVRIYLREIVAPTGFVPGVFNSVVIPKAALARKLISEITGLPYESASAQRALAFVLMPCFSLIMLPESLRTQILPATAAIDPAFLDDLLRYALAGLQALGEATSK